LKLSYFADTDTLYIELNSAGITDSVDMGKNAIIDLDAEGNVVAITVEHASTRADMQTLTLSGIAA